MTSTGFFYPNECFVCKQTTALKRCSRCQMISYCGEGHQKLDWGLHKSICGVLFKLITKKKVSHIYEEFRGCDLQTWINARLKTSELVSHLLGYDLLKHENEMLTHPRCCFVCYDTRQENLVNCTRCPLVSFCNEHPRSSRHDKMCSEYKQCHYLANEYQEDAKQLSNAIISIVNSTPMKSSKLPNSSTEYLHQNLKIGSNSDTFKIYMSTIFAVPLTLFGAIRKLNYPISPKMTFHVSRFPGNKYMYKCWEMLLHLFPDLSFLTMVLSDYHATLNEDVALCRKCSSLGKKLIIKAQLLSFEDYIMKKTYEEPNLTAIVNLDVINPSKKLLKTLSNFSCPLILTTGTEKSMQILEEHFSSSFWKPFICYQGKNEFGSLCSVLHWKEWEVAKPSQFAFIIKAPKDSTVKEKKLVNTKLSQPNPKVLKESKRPSEKILNSFYHGVCSVCKAFDSSVSCKRCKMIFYCGEIHMKKDSSRHKEICKAILKILNKNGTPHLYDNLKTNDEELWLSIKLGFIKEVKFHLKRDLLDFEKQMFLFPKICLACRESDLSELKTCKCGVSLCKIHRDDLTHKTLCTSFNLDMIIGTNKDLPVVPTIEVVALNKNRKNLPDTLSAFMDTFISLKMEKINPLSRNVIKILVSDFLTRPMTFLYAFEKLKISVPKTMVIHIIGAIDKESQGEGCWRIISYWLNNLQSLKVVFIGPELSVKQKSLFTYSLTFNNSGAKSGKTFDFKTIQGCYDQFYKSKAFSKPDMIIGYNLELDKSYLGSVESTWKETLLVIKKINVPFLLTAKSEERGRKDNTFVCSILGKEVKYEFCEDNPYSSLVPERDFKNEGLCYSNDYLIVYRKFTTTKTSEKAILSVDNFEKTKQCKKPIEDERCNNKLKIKKPESKEQRIPENMDHKEKIELNNDELLQKNLLLQQENKILKDNLFLKEENAQLKQRILKLKEDIAALKMKN